MALAGLGRALVGELVDGGGVEVEDDASVTIALETPHDVGAHASEVLIGSTVDVGLVAGAAGSASGRRNAGGTWLKTYRRQISTETCRIIPRQLCHLAHT